MEFTPRTARDDDKAAVRALWQLRFGDGDAFLDWFFRDRWAPDWSAVVTAEDGSLASAMQSWPLTLSLRGQIVPAALVAGVSTQPQWEGHGLMKRMLRYYMQLARQNGAVVTPHTPVDLAVYASSGDFPVTDARRLTRQAGAPAAGGKPPIERLTLTAGPGTASSGEETDSPAAPASGASAPHRLYAPGDTLPWDGLLAVYTAAARRYSGIIRRTPSDFRLKAADYRADGAFCLLRGLPEEPAGYAFFYESDKGLEVPELLALTPPDEQALVDLLAARAGSRALRVKLPPDSASRLPGAAETLAPQGVMGVADVSALLRLVCAPTVRAARLEPAAFILETTDPVVPQNAGRFDISGAPATGAPCAALPAGRLGQFAAGYRSLAELAAEGHADILDADACRALDGLFPKQRCFIVDEY